MGRRPRDRGAGAVGFLNALKPPGMTSHDAVAFVRRFVGGRVGHLGTLDPPAAGVLPLALGSATRLQAYLPEARKSYRAEVLFGVETDTLDTAGEILAARTPEGLVRDRLEQACQAFRGTVMQAPPRVSAVRHGGRRSYERARRGEDFDLPPREAHYHSVRVVEIDSPRALLDVECGPGTYVRALARDLGQALGCGAVLSFLLRTSSGPFVLEEAHTLEEIREAALEGGVGRLLVPADQVLERAGVPGVLLEPAPWGGGQERPAEALDEIPEAGAAVRLLETGGGFVGLGRVAQVAPLRVRLERQLEGAAP